LKRRGGRLKRGAGVHLERPRISLYGKRVYMEKEEGKGELKRDEVRCAIRCVPGEGPLSLGDLFLDRDTG
jgi:hypothetical protein